MIFTSFLFLFVFLPLLLLFYFGAPVRWRGYVLIGGSLIFYAAWRLDFVALLLGMTVFSYAIGNLLFRLRGPVWRFRILVLGVGGNVACLAYFKYVNFGIDQLNVLALALGFGAVSSGIASIILPLGISFFTFHAVSYIVDIYRGTIKTDPGFVNFLIYMALFPHLIAGPIVRFAEVSSQIVDLRPSRADFDRGVVLFMIGFCKKVLIANSLAGVAGAAFSALAPTFAEAWLGAAAYGLQLYFDFSGYSDMAIGLAAMLGIRFPVNFNSPYWSQSISEFWTRWHMTLSRFLRDYIYIPLGGNRHGAMSTYRNLFLTMLIGGLWHGAAWTFIAWGAWHGVLLAVERANGRRPLYWRAPCALRVALTLLLVTLGWVMFNAPSIGDAVRMYASMFNPAAGLSLAALPIDRAFVVVFFAACAIALVAPNAQTLVAHERRAAYSWGVAGLFVVAVHEMFFQALSPFLYFQF